MKKVLWVMLVLYAAFLTFLCGYVTVHYYDAQVVGLVLAAGALGVAWSYTRRSWLAIWREDEDDEGSDE